MAAAPAGTLYALSGGELTALDPTGVVRWQRPSFANAMLVGVGGTIYTADGTNGVGAYSPIGRLLWRCPTGDEVVSLAERADGTVVALGQTGLSAVSAAGHRLWRRPLGHPLRLPSAQPPTIAVDAAGRAYVGSSDGTVRAIAPNGSLLWTLQVGGPTRLGDTPSIALGPDGLLRVTGELPAASGTFPPHNVPHIAIFALSSTGRRLWTIRSLPWSTMPQSVPFSKGVAPLVTAANVLYVPFVGPVYTPGQNDGVEVIAPTGVPLRRLLAGWVGPIAVARDGTVYEVGGNQEYTAVLATHADGGLWWHHPVAYAQAGSVLISRQGTVYASDATWFGPDDVGAITAYSASGRLLWRRAAGLAALAERADGMLLAADGSGVSALGPRGRRLWQRALGHVPASVYAQPSLVVDASGRAYAGTADGLVHALAPNGTILWTLRTGGPTHSGASPSLALGPDGALRVVGTDGVLRLYR
jgi:outer membrane protein assembly factor BamB